MMDCTFYCLIFVAISAAHHLVKDPPTILMGTVYCLIPFVYRKRPQVIYAYSSEEKNRFTKKIFTHARVTLRRGIAGNITGVLFNHFF